MARHQKTSLLYFFAVPFVTINGGVVVVLYSAVIGVMPKKLGALKSLLELQLPRSYFGLALRRFETSINQSFSLTCDRSKSLKIRH